MPEHGYKAGVKFRTENPEDLNVASKSSQDLAVGNANEYRMGDSDGVFPPQPKGQGILLAGTF